MPGDKAAEYLQNAFNRLARRQSYARKKFSPTNAELMKVIEALVEYDKYRKDNNEKSFLIPFSYHMVDLVEVAAATFWGIRKESQIRTKATELRTLKAAEEKSRQRSKKATAQDFEETLSPKALNRYLAGFSRRLDIAHGEEQLTRLSTSHPNFPTSKRKPTTGRRQDLPVKIAHMELERYFAKNHSNVVAAQREEWICHILNASQLYKYSGRTFQRQRTRLRQQIPSFPPRS